MKFLLINLFFISAVVVTRTFAEGEGGSAPKKDDPNHPKYASSEPNHQTDESHPPKGDPNKIGDPSSQGSLEPSKEQRSDKFSNLSAFIKSGDLETKYLEVKSEADLDLVITYKSNVDNCQVKINLSYGHTIDRNPEKKADGQCKAEFQVHAERVSVEQKRVGVQIRDMENVLIDEFAVRLKSLSAANEDQPAKPDEDGDQEGGQHDEEDGTQNHEGRGEHEGDEDGDEGEHHEDHEESSAGHGDGEVKSPEAPENRDRHGVTGSKTSADAGSKPKTGDPNEIGDPSSQGSREPSKENRSEKFSDLTADIKSGNSATKYVETDNQHDLEMIVNYKSKIDDCHVKITFSYGETIDRNPNKQADGTCTAEFAIVAARVSSKQQRVGVQVRDLDNVLIDEFAIRLSQLPHPPANPTDPAKSQEGGDDNKGEHGDKDKVDQKSSSSGHVDGHPKGSGTPEHKDEDSDHKEPAKHEDEQGKSKESAEAGK